MGIAVASAAASRGFLADEAVAGLYAVAARRGLPWIIIKAICDWGVKKDKKGQGLAAKNACAVVEALLDEPTLRAQDLGVSASPAESRAERTFREHAKRARFQELVSKIRDAHRRQQERADDQGRFLRENLSKLRDTSSSFPDLTEQLATLEAARAAAFEQWLNAYNDGSAAFLHNEVDRKQFLDTFGVEILELCRSDTKDIQERMHPREQSEYGAIWAVVDECTRSSVSGVQLAG